MPQREPTSGEYQQLLEENDTLPPEAGCGTGGARSMSTMVERVAQALQQQIATAPFDEPASSFALARAAIAAMREIDAWIRAPGAIKGGWQAMIDAALEGK